MSILKIVAVTLVATLATIQCSVVGPALAPLPAYPAIRYTQVAPPSVLPFSAQVSTFTRNLHVFDAPYAAGVLPGPPAIVQRTVLPAPVAPLHPAPFLPAPLAPAPVIPAPAYPQVAPLYPGVAPAAPVLPYAGPAPVLPYAGPASVLPYAGPAPVLPYAGGAPVLPYAGGGVVPGWPYPGGFVAPVARSVHAVAPGLGPAPLLG